MKNYLLTVLQCCSEENFGQEAIEWAIVTGRVTLTYDLKTDIRAIMGPDASGAGAIETNYDRIIEAYRCEVREHGDALVEIYEASGLLEEILRPVPLAMMRPAPDCELVAK